MTSNTLAISLKALPERVWAIRKFVEAYYEVVFHDPDLLDRMAMATHELMENAAKYARGDRSHLEIVYVPECEPPSLEIAVTNQVAPEDIPPLAEIVNRVSQADDVQGLYLQMIRESAKRGEGSGLGLIRIRAEGDMTLRLETSEDRICIRASARGNLSTAGET